MLDCNTKIGKPRNIIGNHSNSSKLMLFILEFAFEISLQMTYSMTLRENDANCREFRINSRRKNIMGRYAETFEWHKFHREYIQKCWSFFIVNQYYILNISTSNSKFQAEFPPAFSSDLFSIIREGFKCIKWLNRLQLEWFHFNIRSHWKFLKRNLPSWYSFVCFVL